MWFQKFLKENKREEGFYVELTWGIMIVIYLFTAGVSAGAMATSNIAYLYGGKDFERVIRWGAYIAPFPISLGLAFLLLDLGSPFNFYHLFMILQVRSPMSYGSWAILFFTILSVLYLYFWLPAKFQVLGVPKNLEQWKKRFSQGMPILSVGVATYTGFLLNAAHRPLWASPILPVLFLISALSTGIASVIFVAALSPWERGRHKELHVLTKVDAFLIVLEFLVLTIMVIIGIFGSLSVSKAYGIMVFGHFAWIFWLLIICLGLVLPFSLEVMELKDKVPVKWAWSVTIGSSFLVLLGGFFVRYIITYAGQWTRWLN
jgi:formate-dependent nitrite reductase membrane component NrfD